MKMVDTPHSRSPVRVLLLIDQPVLADFITLAFADRASTTRVTQNVEKARTALQDWRTHLVVIDIDIAKGKILDQLGSVALDSSRVPVVD